VSSLRSGTWVAGRAWHSPIHLARLTPTTELLRLIAGALEREPSNPAVVAAFDLLVMLGQLVPFVPGWWELIEWSC
jgi:hypothetical protein